MTELRRIFFLGLMFISINGYSQTWLASYNQSLEYYNSDQYEDALKAGEDALTRYKREGELDHANYRVILRQLSVTCDMLNDMQMATSYAEQEVESWKKATTVDEAAYIDALDNLGVMLSLAGDFETAIVKLKEAVELTRVTEVKSDVERAIIEGHLAEAYFASGQLELSKAHFEASLGILDQLEEIPNDYLNFIYSYGTLSVELKNYSTSIKYLSNIFQCPFKSFP